MPRSYAPEFRRRVVELVRSGRSVAVVAAEIGVSEATVYRWRAQDRIDRGERPGLSSLERSELAQARRRIRELEIELSNRTPPTGTVIHTDHGSQFSSWAFSERVRQAGLVPSIGTVGDAFDNALIEAFWARLQTELLNRKKWKTRIELSTALFDYLEIFHNRNRRHSALGMLTPTEFEKVNNQTAKAA